ncbi:DUF5677 domain-containing protein [Peribacillus sp. YIM B13472]|uniref:DUF5677 domain-containing protein n=1 Tax=Peribacillus sp. YIM B13472 TaxID=3366297 RepID=UPI00366B1834
MVDKVELIDNTYKRAFFEMEETDEFINISANQDVAKVFYTLYNKCKRLFITMLYIKEAPDKNVTYYEALPLLRTFIEAYFHLTYVMSETNTTAIKEGYEALEKNSHAKRAAKLKHAESLTVEDMEFIEEYQGFKMPREYEFLDDMRKLSAKTNQLQIYRTYYTDLNSYIHFNPSTFLNHVQVQENKFVFNFNEPQDREDYTYIEKVIYAIGCLFICEVNNFLNNKELEGKIGDLIEGIHEEVFGIKDEEASK